MKTISRFLLACALTLSGGGAFAQVAAADSSFQKFFVSVTGVGRQTVGFGSGGQPIVTQGVPQLSTAGGPVLVDRGVTLANNSGGQLTANARVSIPPAVLGQIIRRGLLGASVLGTGVALYDLARELGYTPTRAADGSVTVVRADPTRCLSNCFSYAGLSGTSPMVDRPYLPSLQEAGNWYIGRRLSPGNNCTGNNITSFTPTGPTSGFVTCAGASPGFTTNTVNFATQARAPDAPNNLPSSLAELEAAIASQSGWPSSSRVSRAVADATANQPAPSFPATPTVTGPATSPGNTTSRTNPDGSTTTITQTYNHTYSGPNINTTTTTVTSTCTGGSCNTTTQTETPTVDPQPFEMPCGLAGQAPCAVKVDETGMPTADDVATDGPELAEKEYETWIEGLAAANPFPEINWAFALPTACGVIPTPVFSPWIESIDVCQFQPMFHELMTVVWMLGGLFGAISLFMRNSLAT